MRNFEKEIDLWQKAKKDGILKYAFKKSIFQSTWIFLWVSFLQFVSWKDGVHLVANEEFSTEPIYLAAGFFIILALHMLLWLPVWFYKGRKYGKLAGAE